MKTAKWFLAGVLASLGGLAYAAGFYPNLPVVGGSAYCFNIVNGVCQATVPAGTQALTGLETTAFDTGLAQGAYPQTVSVPSSALALAFGTNRLIGGDFNTNLEQRFATTKGIASLAGISANAAVVGADGWWLYGSGTSNLTATIASGTTEVLPALGTTKALRVARTASTAGSLLCTGQTLDQTQSGPLIGNNAVFSFWELNGGTMNSAGGAFTVEISYSSAAAAAGTQATLGYAGSQGSKYAIGTNATTFGTSGPTNQTAAVPVSSGVATQTSAAPATVISGGSIGANGFVTFPGNTTWAREVVVAPIPATIPGTTTAVTDVSVQICFTSATTAGSSNYALTSDWIELQGLQLEAKPSTATPTLPYGVTTPTTFERRPASVEALIDYSYWYYNYENQSIVTAVATCENTSATVANCFVPYPVPMRIVPAVLYTSGFQAFVQVAETSVNACTLAAAATYALVPNNLGTTVQCTATTLPAAGTMNILSTLGTSSATGIIVASALP